MNSDTEHLREAIPAAIPSTAPHLPHSGFCVAASTASSSPSFSTIVMGAATSASADGEACSVVSSTITDDELGLETGTDFATATDEPGLGLVRLVLAARVEAPLLE